MKFLIREFWNWYFALLEAIPGEIGSAIRCRFYGFRCGRACRVLSHVRIFHPVRLTLGNRVGISNSCQINAAGGVSIGDNVLLGPGVKIWSQNHRIDDIDTPIGEQGYQRLEVEIADDCWIGAGAIILPGVVLESGTVVGAGSVVTKSVNSEFTILAGNPARKIGDRDPARQNT